MKTIRSEIIEQMRFFKRQGLSLKAIAKELHIGKTTVSYYCRDLYQHKKRVFKTETEARDRITHTLKPCPDCCNPIRKDNYTCRPCYIKRLKVRGFKREIVKQKRVDIVIESAVRKEAVVPSAWKKLLVVNVCPDNHTVKAHHYILDSQNRGVCKHCGATKEFRPHWNEPFSYNNDLTTGEKFLVVAEKY